MLGLAVGVGTAHVVVGIMFIIALIIALSARATKAVIIICVLAIAYIALAYYLGAPATDPQAVLNAAGNAASDAVNKLPLP